MRQYAKNRFVVTPTINNKTMKTIYFTFLLVLTQVSFAQQQDSNTIDSQFETIISESNRYKEFKVVPLTKLQQLKSNTAQHISGLNTEISNLETTIETQKNSIGAFETQIEGMQQEINQLKSDKASIGFLGMSLDKGTYNAIVWTLILILALGLVFFALQYKKSHVETKLAQDNLRAADEELQEVRRKSLEKEQKLGRQLQDERNRHSRTSVV